MYFNVLLTLLIIPIVYFVNNIWLSCYLWRWREGLLIVLINLLTKYNLISFVFFLIEGAIWLSSSSVQMCCLSICCIRLYASKSFCLILDRFKNTIFHTSNIMDISLHLFSYMTVSCRLRQTQCPFCKSLSRGRLGLCLGCIRALCFKRLRNGIRSELSFNFICKIKAIFV